MKRDEREALIKRAKRLCKRLWGDEDGWGVPADFAAAEIDRERRRVRRAKAKKARKR